MPNYCLFRVEKHVLLRRTRELVAQGWSDCAELLAHLGEIHDRGLYREEGYDSLFAWCMGELHFSEGAAFRRIRAARAAREFPVLFAAVAEGRLHLTAILLLAPYLVSENVEDLVTEATHRSRREIESLLARRFPKPDVPTEIRTLAPVAVAVPLAPARVEFVSPVGSSEPATPEGPPTTLDCFMSSELAPARVVNASASIPAIPAAPATRIAPLAPERYELRTTLDQEAHDLLREAQDLLSHVISGRDAAEVLKRVLRDWVQAQRRRKFAQTSKPRARRSKGNGRHIPAKVRREVYLRDGGRCTFVGTNGHRCDSRKRLQYDHIIPFALGGTTCKENLRLRCRAHNQYEAERVYGAGFMRAKRAGSATPPATFSARRGLRGTRAGSSGASGSSGSRPGSTPGARGCPSP